MKIMDKFSKHKILLRYTGLATFVNKSRLPEKL